jgi:glutamine synthetase
MSQNQPTNEKSQKFATEPVSVPASIDDFSFGASNRGASIRIPMFTTSHEWKGYLEDRRPASDSDPYLIVYRIMKTVKISHANAIKAVG